MSTDAPAKATPVAKPAVQAAPAKPAAPAAAASAAQPAKQSTEAVRDQSRMDRIRTAVESSKKKQMDAAAPAEPAAQAEPAEPLPATAEPPTVLKTDVKPVDTPAVASADDPIDKWNLPANASAEAVKNFADIRTEAKARKVREAAALQKVTELENQLTTYRNASPADTAATEALQARLKSAEDRLAVVDLRSHPDFIKQYVAPKTKALAEAKEVLDYSDVKSGDLAQLLTKPTKEFNAVVAKLTEGMNTMDATTVQTALRNAHKLQAGEADVLSRSGELHTQLQQKSAQTAKAAFEAVSKDLGPTGDFLQPLEIPEGLAPADKASAEAYNASLSGVQANAEKLAFGRVDERGVATMSYKAATLDHMISHTIPRIQAEYSKLVGIMRQQNEVIKQLRGTGQGAADLGGSGGGSSSVDVSKMSIEQRVKYRLAEAKRAKRGE